jgi:TRAP-type C4-dicarboxylate transport system permease small subunit
MRALHFAWQYAAEGAVVALMAVMVTTLGIQVFWRFVLQDPPSWTEELARYAFVWITFLGAAVAYRHRAHIVVDTVLYLLPIRARAALAWVVDTLVAIALATLLVEGVKILEPTSTVRATMLQVPMSYIYAAIPVSAGLMLAYQVERVVARLRDGNTVSVPTFEEASMPE